MLWKQCLVQSNLSLEVCDCSFGSCFHCSICQLIEYSFILIHEVDAITSFWNNVVLAFLFFIFPVKFRN